MAEDIIAKFYARDGPRSISLVMPNCPPRGVVRVTWPTLRFYTSLNISGMA